MGACGGVMGGAIGRGNYAMSFKTYRGGQVWGCVFCVKAVCNCVGYIVVGRLQVSFYTLYIAVSCRVGVVFRGHCSACNRLVCGRCWCLCRCFILFWCRLVCWAGSRCGFFCVIWVLQLQVF